MSKSFGWLWVVALWAVGLFAALALQEDYYSRTGPFHDSLSYYRQLASRIEMVQRLPFHEVIGEAFRGSTTAVPWLMASVVGLATRHPQLWMGPVFQAPWILLFMLALYFFFKDGLKQRVLFSVVATLPFVFNIGVFFFNRGWPDFAMDMMSYVALGTGLVFYLWGWETKKRRVWVAAGILLGLSCWWRALDAVYLALILAPCELWRWWVQRKEQPWKESLWMGVPLLVMMGIYLINDFAHLYNYYCVRNVDSLAKLPLEQALGHWNYLWQFKVGGWGVPLLVVFTWRTYQAWQVWGWGFWKKLNVVALWCGVVPLGVLILNGMGLNPFVCFPALFGVVMFLLFPFRGLPAWKVGPIGAALAALFATGALLDGYRSNDEYAGRFPSAQVENMVWRMQAEVKREGLREVSYRICNAGFFDWGVPIFWMVYKQGGYFEKSSVVCDGVKYNTGFFWTKEFIEKIKNKRYDELAAELAKADYFYLLDFSLWERSTQISWANYTLEAYQSEFEEVWKRLKKRPIGETLKISDQEFYQLYRIEGLAKER